MKMKNVQPWAAVKRSSKDPARTARVKDRVESALLEMSLADLRKEVELTQAELAARVEISQAELSRAEARGDHKVSTIRRYLEALGFDLELVAVGTDGRRVKLT